MKLDRAGNWTSAISSSLITGDSVSIDEPRVTGDALYYIERRPQENGRCVIVQVRDSNRSDALPAPYSCRSRVHEYGGGSYCIDEQHTLYFVNDSDQDIYRIEKQQIKRITTAQGQRFADIICDSLNGQLIAVCETHPGHGADTEIKNSIVSIDIDSGAIDTLIEGDDFYASPRLNSTATRLCWQSWNHPNMPWDGNKLWLADIDEQLQLSDRKHIAGADKVSTFQPQWSPDGQLFFISDDTGWWHLYRYITTATDITEQPVCEQLTAGDKEFGLPQWVFAQSTYAFISDTEIACSYRSQGKSCLALLSLADEPQLADFNLSAIDPQWQEFSSIRADGNHLCFIAASSSSFPQLISARISARLSATERTELDASIIRSSSRMPISNDHYSIARTIDFKNRFQQTVYASYYPPTNPDKQLADGELPPLIVICHGGPTGQSSIALDPKKQFWTSRGFALLDVNYSGSTGYGREYRSRLDGKWGKLDVSDCCDAALYAVSQGLADERQLIIRGSSAGGYTVLSALTFENVFSAGASYYGISELTSLASDTHKFEARYLDRLIGPYPEAKDLYQQRSPINHSEQLNCPVIFFQGIDDRVVPKEQAEAMFTALSKKGLTVAAQYYEGEQHGFRKAETIEQSLENELSFYQLVFKLK
ncbi:MAG: S9 family peptidase, partial [Proteobacteria bacterium]|nr:S9 family peptidase [Pseudomonadota bacterium]